MIWKFRRGLLGVRGPHGMCFALCAPLQGWLSAVGIETTLIKALFPEINHVWLQRDDGTIIDPTADQLGLDLPGVYIGPLPKQYQLWMDAENLVGQFAC